MGNEEDIFIELFNLRDNLRDNNVYSNGRKPEICSDESLLEIAKRLPTRVADFGAIVGLGPKFLDSYAPSFIEVTKKYAIVESKGSTIDKRSADTLRELEKKLINISKGNRLLFQPKINNRNTFDFTTVEGIEHTSLIFGRKRHIELCDSSNGPEAARNFKILSGIIREVNRDMRERGQYDLYVAYPFAEGKFVNDDFDVRAPLALFPVKLEKEAQKIFVVRDDSRDCMYNSTLILAHIKFNKTNRPVPGTVFDDYDELTFWEEMIEFYREEGLDVEGAEEEPVPFVNYAAGEFPKYAPGHMHTVPNMVIGKYPMFSNSIQRDIDCLVTKNAINGILNDLIKDVDDTDLFGEGLEPMTAEELKAKGMSASEGNLIYINSLNSAQENVLTAIDKGDKLVVQGPPGTGKSQVITGLITSAIDSGKTVLMVSEKKTALDVVYSRLGELNRFALLIDDVGNKDLFYKQLDNMFASAERPLGILDLNKLSTSIDNDVTLLDHIADRVYSPGNFGVEPYKLYEIDERSDLSDKDTFETYRIIKDCIPPSLMSIMFDDVCYINDMFKDRTTLSNIVDYNTCLSKAPWLGMMRNDLTDYDIGNMRADLMDLENQMIDFKGKNFLSRMFSKGKLQRDATSMLDKYFERYSQQLITSVLDDPMVVYNNLDTYDLYSMRATGYKSLTDDEKVYAESIMRVSDKLNTAPRDCNDLIQKVIISEHLRSFDADNRQTIQHIEDFDSIINDMDGKISQKRDLTKNRVEQILQENLRYITESKRRGDILRVVESKRRWSLNKFLNRFSFEIFKGIKIWLLTPDVVSEIIPLEMGLFDLLIFDEASQMFVEKGIPSIYRAKKVVVAGDHKQLRPSNLGAGRIEYDEEETDEEYTLPAALEEESLLDLARSKYDNVLLNFHYRSRFEELIAFSNHAFYKGKLYVSPNVIKPEKPPIEMHRVDGIWENKTNRAEAEEVIQILKDFFNTRKNNETVGIITFNIAQRDFINDLLDEACSNDPELNKIVTEEMNRKENGEDIGLFIKNIESVQGDERDMIIFSIGYAKNLEGKMIQRFGWLNNRGGENRLNVAISRSKRKIHIVVSVDPDDLKVEEAKNDGPRILKKYLQYAKAISDEDSELACSILESFGGDNVHSSNMQSNTATKDKVYNELIKRGYDVERDVGIGGYSIDLAVKKDGAYYLGIECDGKLYGMSASARERDYHRQKYLEARGWKMHRVWAPLLWKNMDKEISRIEERMIS